MDFLSAAFDSVLNHHASCHQPGHDAVLYFFGRVAETRNIGVYDLPTISSCDEIEDEFYLVTGNEGFGDFKPPPFFIARRPLNCMRNGKTE